MGEDRTEGAQQDESLKEHVTVGEAAKLLGIHRNTVHHRIKTGRITAQKVVEGGREIYRVERDSLGVGRTSAHVHTLDAQRTTVSEELSRMIATRLDEIVRDYTHELGALREELGAERVRREMAETTLREGIAEEQRRREEAERERDGLRQELYALSEPRESPETAEEQQGRETSPAPIPQARRRPYSGRGGVGCSEDRRSMQNDQSAQDAKRLLVAMSTNHAEARIASPYGLDRPFSPSWADAEQAGLDRVRRDNAIWWLIENNLLKREEEAEKLRDKGKGASDYDYVYGSVFTIIESGRELLEEVWEEQRHQ